MIKKSKKFVRKRLPYWICYETDLDYEKVRKISEQEDPEVWGEETQKGLIQIFFRRGDAMVQISPNGKLTIYFDCIEEKISKKTVKGLIEKLCGRRVKFEFYKCDPATEEHYASLAADYEVSLALDMKTE